MVSSGLISQPKIYEKINHYKTLIYSNYSYVLIHSVILLCRSFEIVWRKTRALGDCEEKPECFRFFQFLRYGHIKGLKFCNTIISNPVCKIISPTFCIDLVLGIIKVMACFVWQGDKSNAIPRISSKNVPRIHFNLMYDWWRGIGLMKYVLLYVCICTYICYPALIKRYRSL